MFARASGNGFRAQTAPASCLCSSLQFWSAGAAPGPWPPGSSLCLCCWARRPVRIWQLVDTHEQCPASYFYKLSDCLGQAAAAPAQARGMPGAGTGWGVAVRQLCYSLRTAVFLALQGCKIHRCTGLCFLSHMPRNCMNSIEVLSQPVLRPLSPPRFFALRPRREKCKNPLQARPASIVFATACPEENLHEKHRNPAKPVPPAHLLVYEEDYA